MNKEWSPSWKGSVQPRKQRKYVYGLPLHLARKVLTSILKKDLRVKFGRSVKLRKGDTVKVMRGQYKGKTGKVEKMSIRGGKVYIENVNIVKKDGNKVLVPIHASNLMVTELYTEDKKRMKRLEKEKKK